MADNKLILGIETSCDETAAAVVADGRKVLSNIIATQVPWHQKYGGVVPEIASRKHLELMDMVLAEACKEAGTEYRELDGIAVTYGPGLVGSLLIGLVAAKTMAWVLHKPLVGVNHILGHIYANLLEHEDIEVPLVCLTVSGGHTDLIYMEGWGDYRIMGRTRDDAAGEAFDKVARVLGLPYPGGPPIDELSRKGNPGRYRLPLPQVRDGAFDFSFSGIKTAVINLLHNLKQRNEVIEVADIAASFQRAVVDHLVEKVSLATGEMPVRNVLLSGGVAANSLLRKQLKARLASLGIRLYYPSLRYCTDNAAMIACAGYYLLERGHTSSLDLDAVPRLKL